MIAISNVGGFTVPHLVVAPDGIGYVAVSGSDSDLVGARIARDGTVSPAEQIAPASENPHHLGLGIAADGTVTAAYTVGTGNSARVDARERPADRPFVAPQRISPTKTTATLVAFKETNDGFAAALLCLRDQRHCTYAVYVRRPGGAAFARAARIPAGSTMPALGAASGDRAVAIWVASAPRRAPVIRGVDITARGRIARALPAVRRAPTSIAVLSRLPNWRWSRTGAPSSPGRCRFVAAGPRCGRRCARRQQIDSRPCERSRPVRTGTTPASFA